MKFVITWFILLACSSAVSGAGQPAAYQVDGISCDGWWTCPSPDAPLVVIIHDWDGLTGYEVKRAEMLAELGYAVFCADLFGAGVRPTSTDEKRKLTGALYADREKMRSLLNGALVAAAERGGHVDNAVVAGYCFGGTAALELARSGANLKGFVSFHGGLDLPEGQDCTRIKGSLLILHGSADSSVSMDDFAGLANALEAAGVKHEMTTYSGAPHAFSVFGSDRYRKDADEKSWRRFTQFLKDVL